ncbi:MAG TPA: 50S ribosomal protein L3 [Syntrophales bacterium]|nr:50S ribosomal protein L3 [Syntrophales bacterium]
MKGLIGKKLGMTQVFSIDGAVPVTAIEAGPCYVIQKKTAAKDGYSALQLGFGHKKQKNVSKPLQGHFNAANRGFFRVLRELRFDSTDDYEQGKELTVDMFQPGEYVDIVGTSKGRGFTGGVKRYGFRGGEASHGSMFHRAPGSIGASAYPSRVFKGKRLPGHMGNQRVTAQGLLVFGVRPDQNLILVKGAVPGHRNSIVLIKNSVKNKKSKSLE